MTFFPHAHATHPQWHMATALVLAQLRAQMAEPGYADSPTLGLVYLTDHYAAQAQDILDLLGSELPEVTDWSGTVGVGIAAHNVEYWDEPALAVMLCDLPLDQYRVFSGVAPLTQFAAHTALVHADASAPELAELVRELACRTDSGYLFGGLLSSRTSAPQIAQTRHGHLPGQGGAGGVFHGGLSGVAFGPQVNLVSRVTQGCYPVGAVHRVTAVDGPVLLTLDGEPALQVLERELGVQLRDPSAPDWQQAIQTVRQTLVGLSPEGTSAVGRTGHFGLDVLVRHLVGIDPVRSALVVAGHAPVGSQLAFCQRNLQAARADLTRICAEIREELEPEELPAEAIHPLAAALADDTRSLPLPHPGRRMRGAIYVSCAGRGAPHFGSHSAELQLVRHALGDVPLVGFFASGEIAHDRLYGYTGVLTVFTD